MYVHNGRKREKGATQGGTGPPLIKTDVTKNREKGKTYLYRGKYRQVKIYAFKEYFWRGEKAAPVVASGTALGDNLLLSPEDCGGYGRRKRKRKVLLPANNPWLPLKGGGREEGDGGGRRHRHGRRWDGRKKNVGGRENGITGKLWCSGGLI